MPAPDVDWRHTPAATMQRRLKARTLSRYAWERGLDADDIDRLDPTQLTHLARAVGVAPPSTNETWDLVGELLRAMADWAERHPFDQAARRPRSAERAGWITTRPLGGRVSTEPADATASTVSNTTDSGPHQPPETPGSDS